MKRVAKQEALPRVHEILRGRYGDLIPISGQGIAKGERIELVMEGKRVRCVVKTSSGGRVSFGRRDGKWSGLDGSDFVIIVAPTTFESDDLVVSMFDQRVMREVFDANQAAQEKAGMGELPNWIAPFHEEGRGARGVGDGFGDKALWREPFSSVSSAPSAAADKSKRPMTIPEAKKQLAEALGVPIEAIEIVVRA